MTFKQYFGNSNILLFLIGSNVAVAVIIWLSAWLLSGSDESILMSWIVMPAQWSSFILKPWSALTYMFTQVSFLHLLFNMLWLLWFGRIFIYCASEKQLLLTYLCGGLAGAICFLTVCNLGGAPAGSYLTGASASVLAVMTAASVMAPNLELNLLLLGQIRLKYVALLCIVLTFIGIGGGDAGGFSAHIGGVIFGFFAPSIFSRKVAVNADYTSPLRRLIHKIKARKRKVPDALRQPVGPHGGARLRPSSNPASYDTESRRNDEERLDQLLDKVRVSGYDSLSKAEKSELNAISSRL
ncbi:MAG: rhomboid family intramembrane serine protease [Muribaculaceae bacterium]|nr:rhomboid family intramembrane serine protease [Muribaculaceae bacterium]